MAFKCGHCGKTHNKVAEARECAEQQQDGKQPEQEVYEFLSMGQQKFLGDLMRQFGLVFADSQTEINKISYREGKKILSGLIDARRLKATNKPYSLPDGVLLDPSKKNMPGKVREPTRKRLPDCEPGYYAVPDPERPGELLFYWVKVKKGHGPYAGWTFIDSVVGGHADEPLNGRPAIEAINAIKDFGIENAGIMYSMRFKTCYNCNRSLTLYASSVLKLGRHCASLKGKLDEWDALNANAPGGWEAE
jgi:hypothetical protein